MPKLVIEITDDTKNVLFHPTAKRVYGDDKSAPPLKRRTPRRSKAKPKRIQSDG